MAPEIIAREPHSFAVDWWSLGVLSFELMFRESPFLSSNRATLFQMIQDGEPNYPQDGNPIQIDFIKQLLMKNPHKRGNLETLRGHPFWEGLDLDSVAKLEVKPQYIPVLIYEGDTRNFDPQFTKEPALDSMATPPGQTTIFECFSTDCIGVVAERAPPPPSQFPYAFPSLAD
jgi:serine/threonine protein kinase